MKMGFVSYHSQDYSALLPATLYQLLVLQDQRMGCHRMGHCFQLLEQTSIANDLLKSERNQILSEEELEVT